MLTGTTIKNDYKDYQFRYRRTEYLTSLSFKCRSMISLYLQQPRLYLVYFEQTWVLFPSMNNSQSNRLWTASVNSNMKYSPVCKWAWDSGPTGN